MAEDASRREWRERLDRWEESCLGGSEFALQEGVSVSTLYRWARRLKLRPVQRRKSGRSRSSVRPSVLPVLVKKDAVPPVVPAPQLEVLLRGGEVVRVPRGFDEDTLVRVVRALEGAP